MRKVFALLLLLVAASALNATGDDVCANNYSQIDITILAPANTTYSGTVPLEIDATRDNSFLHNATVTATIGGTAYALPEGQNSYRSEAELEAGYYTADFLVDTGKVVCVDGLITAERAGASVDFAVAGQVSKGNETIYIPGVQPIEIRRSSPTRAEYSLGETVDITVFLLDIDNERITGASVVAVVRTPDGAEHPIPLQEELIGGKAAYSNTYTFAQDGFYEIKVTAEKDGYAPAEAYMPAIKSGEEAPKLPEGVFCQQGYCIRVESPSELETYPTGSDVELRIQVIEETTTHPVTDATASASWANTSIGLGYDWNGYYANTTGNMAEGDHLVTFTVLKEGITLLKNITLHISPDRLAIAPINPVPGGNVTEDFITMQVRVTDQEGEAVTNANVRAIVTTPLTGTRTVPLTRNADTGFYESEFTFSDPGQYTVKIVASKIGYVSSESLYTFDVVIMREGIQLTEQDVVIAALIIGVLLVIATLWKALL